MIVDHLFSLHQVIVIVFHSRVGPRRAEHFLLKGRFQFVSEARFVPGSRLGEHPCAFLIEPGRQ